MQKNLNEKPWQKKEWKVWENDYNGRPCPSNLLIFGTYYIAQNQIEILFLLLQSKCILVVIPPQLPPISRGCPCDANLRHYDGLSHGGIKHSGVSLNFFAEMTKYFFKNSFGAPAKKPAINTVPFSIFFRDLLPTHVSFHYIKNYAYKDFVIKFFVASREWQKMLESIK